MYNAGKIIVGLAVFVVLMTFPFWYNAGKAAPPPELQMPKDEKQCVESKAFMRAKHMELIDDWRLDVVRNGRRMYTGVGGKQYNMSLQNTCMSCHTSKEKFCDQCHSYVAVAPNCWSCHIEPKEKK
jgi:hypothetical protein